MSHDHDHHRIEEYRRKAKQAHEKAEAMLDEEARRIMFRAAAMWEAKATSAESNEKPK